MVTFTHMVIVQVTLGQEAEHRFVCHIMTCVLTGEVEAVALSGEGNQKKKD